MPSNASSGHKLGQLIGDWWEGNVVFPLLQSVADELDLFLDCRFTNRSCRTGSKVIWRDDSGNDVDYDFVLEVGGTNDEVGTPVAFIECFWRRGSRHSKDKARDDTNKLLPMRSTHPTARFLSIAAAGEFTVPAREYVTTRNVDLFFLPKPQILEAFQRQQLTVDYPDSADEEQKAEIVREFEANYSPEVAKAVYKSLREVSGAEILDGYTSRVKAALSAMPVAISITQANISQPKLFSELSEFSLFLGKLEFEFGEKSQKYALNIEYSDGSVFETDFVDIESILHIHEELDSYISHMKKIHD